jgi:integrase
MCLSCDPTSESQEWRIPAKRMKMKVPHIVPLSAQAIAILEDIQPATGDAKYVFPSPRSRARPLSNVALLAALRRLGYSHGTMMVSIPPAVAARERD